MTFALLVRRFLPAVFVLSISVWATPCAGADSTADQTPSVEGRTATPDAVHTDAKKDKPDGSVEEILVTGTSVTEAVDQARFSESIVDVLTAKDFAVTGDTGVADALGRVTGVTTIGDKYVYVRGLGERYSSTLFNDAMLPSPDPVRRVVPLDLFPAGVMEQLSVQKTYAPYLPADFAGGSVQMKTRSVPAEREAKMSISTEVRPGTSFTRHAWYGGSSSDWTGYDGGYRHLPGDIDTLIGSTPEQQQAVGLELNRAFDTTNKTIAPNFKLKGSYANNVDLPIGKVGFLMGGQATNKWNHLRIQRATSSGGTSSVPFNYSTEDSTTNSVEYSGLGGLQWKPSRTDTVNATLFYTHNTDKRYLSEDAYLAESESNVTDIHSEWEEQTLWTAQLGGIHNLPRLRNLDIDWGVTYATASRVKPDARFYRFDHDPATGARTFSHDASNERTWEALTDDAWDAHLNTEIPVKLTDQILSTLKVGARYFDKQRDSGFRRFRFGTSKPGTQYDQLPIGDIFADPNINPFYWKLQEASAGTDQYTAEEEIIAGFLQTDTDFGSKCHWMVGTRYETSSQSVSSPGTPVPLSAIDNAGFRPGTELTWKFRDDLQLRGAFSQTVNRPDLREISPALFLNPEDRHYYFGSSDLKVAQILNYDLRLEWYHDGPDHVQLAGFYKSITDPIEQVLMPAGNRRTWANSKSAILYGLELEVRQGLSVLGRWADDFYVRSNVSWIYSEAKAPDSQTLTHPTHALQGQSPWVTNFQLTWDNLPTDTEATLALNVSGKRISDLGTKVGAVGFEDAYEQPRPVLDFVLRHGARIFGYDLDLTFKAKNLIDSKYENSRGGVTEMSYRPGRIFSLEVGKDF